MMKITIIRSTHRWGNKLNNVGAVKNKTLSVTGQKYARYNLHCWKWISQTIQSANCAPARRLKRRNKCVLPNSEIILKCETNRWKLVHFLHTKIIPALMVIEADSVWWEPYTLTHTLLCTLIHTLLCVDSVRVSHTLLCVDSVREIQFNIQTSSKVSWSNRFK